MRVRIFCKISNAASFILMCVFGFDIISCSPKNKIPSKPYNREILKFKSCIEDADHLIIGSSCFETYADVLEQAKLLDSLEQTDDRKNEIKKFLRPTFFESPFINVKYYLGDEYMKSIGLLRNGIDDDMVIWSLAAKDVENYLVVAQTLTPAKNEEFESSVQKEIAQIKADELDKTKHYIDEINGIQVYFFDELMDYMQLFVQEHTYGQRIVFHKNNILVEFGIVGTQDNIDNLDRVQLIRRAIERMTLDGSTIKIPKE